MGEKYRVTENETRQLCICRAIEPLSVLLDPPLKVRLRGVSVLVTEYLPGVLDRHTRRDREEAEPCDRVVRFLEPGRRAARPD